MNATVLQMRTRLRLVDAAVAAARHGERLIYRRGKVQEQRCSLCSEIIRHGRCRCPEAA